MSTADTPPSSPLATTTSTSFWQGWLVNIRDALVPLGVLPLIATFVVYAYQVGVASYFAIPRVLVKPDVNVVYGLLLTMIPVVLIFAIFVLASQPTVTYKRATIKKTDVATPLSLVLLGRTYLVVVYSIAIAIFFEPLQRVPRFTWLVAIFSGLFVVIQLLLFGLERLTHAATPAEDTVRTRDIVARYWLAFAAAGFVAFVCALSSSYGVREAQTAQWYYVLPGSAPEIVLLTQADGYVTAEYRPQPLTLYPVYRWREWKEHRAMYLIRTGALPKMAPIDANDPRILVPESPEPRLP